MGRLDTLFTQMNTLKKIQRPSDDPIVAGRSLKLRINVMEAEQHKNNVDEAKAWMDVTEAALSNMTEILKEIRTRANQAANGTLTADDRQKIVNDMEELYKQLQQESNVTYAGRYVFSGFKTDQPVYLEKDTKLENSSVISNKLNLGEDIEADIGTVLKKGSILENDIFAADGTRIAEKGVALVDDIILDTKTTISRGSTIEPGSKLEGHVVLEGEITLSADAILPDGTTIPAGTTLPKGTILPVGTTLPKGTLNPEVLGKISNQDIKYEVGVGTTVGVNTLGMPELMSQIGPDIESIITALKSDPPLSDEELNKLFTDMIGTMDERLSTVSEMTASLGSRQSRLEYTESRLIDDKTNLTELLSKTEDVNLEDTYVDFNTQYMVYQSALQATSKIVMTNLGDFLR